MKTTTSKYASYIYVKEGEKVSKTKELSDNVYLDYNENDELVGIEIFSHLELTEYDNKVDYEKK
jgi:uncharacterized protein YuzE